MLGWCKTLATVCVRLGVVSVRSRFGAAGRLELGFLPQSGVCSATAPAFFGSHCLDRCGANSSGRDGVVVTAAFLVAQKESSTKLKVPECWACHVTEDGAISLEYTPTRHTQLYTKMVKCRF